MEQPLESLRNHAAKCRDLASSALTSEARQVLTGLAQHYEKKATELEAFGPSHRFRRPAFKWELD